jgi:hypothetical protein
MTSFDFSIHFHALDFSVSSCSGRGESTEGAQGGAVDMQPILSANVRRESMSASCDYTERHECEVGVELARVHVPGYVLLTFLACRFEIVTMFSLAFQAR